MKKSDQQLLVGGGNYAPSENPITFAQALENQKDALMITIFELSSISHHPPRTIENWLYGVCEPLICEQEQILRILSDASLPPSRRMQKHLKSLYSLTWDVYRHRWRLRLTINVGKKIVGKRICVDIKCISPKEAVAQRRTVISAFKKLGLEIIIRRQAR